MSSAEYGARALLWGSLPAIFPVTRLPQNLEVIGRLVHSVQSPRGWHGDKNLNDLSRGAEFLPGDFMAISRIQGTGWSVPQQSFGRSASSVVIRALCHPDSEPPAAPGNYFMKVEFILVMQSASGLCMPAKCLAPGATLPLGSCFSEPL